jgi:predicted transcriptional regulator
MEIRISPEQEAQLAQIAEQGGRSTDEVAQEALADGVAQVSYKDDIRRKILEGLEDQRRGRLADGEAVLARIQAEIDALED